MQPTYRIGPHTRVPAGPHASLIIDGSGQNRELLPNSLAKNLSACASFCSLEEHARTLWSKASFFERLALLKYVFEKHFKEHGFITLGSRGCREMLATVLKDFVEKHYFISAETFLRWAAASTHAVLKIASLGLITKNKVDELSESLESYIKNTKKWERSIDFFVIDDSPEAKTRHLYRDQLKKLRETYGVPISYAGWEEKKSFVAELERTGIPREILQFALFDEEKLGMTYGINRNAFLLHTAGGFTLSADDDIIGRIAKSPAYKEGSEIQFENPFEVRYFSDRKAALESVSFSDDDLLTIHEQALGKTIGHYIREAPSLELLDVKHMDAGFARMIKKREGNIVLTLMGIVGDSGSNSPTPVLFLTGKEREKMFASETQYRTFLKSREICKVSEKVKIGRAGHLMTGFLGMDNRDILPPFFPLLRMEDATFGTMIQKAQYDSCVAYLPWVVMHCPREQRYHDDKKLFEYWEQPFGPFDAVSAALYNFQPELSNQSMSRSLKRMAEHLIDFGRMPFDEYRELLIPIRAAERSSLIISYGAFLKEHARSPRYWTDDMKALIKYAIQKSTDPIILAPDYLVTQLGQEKAEKLIQKLVLQFGELVKWWPDIVSKTKELKKKGIRLAQPV